MLRRFLGGPMAGAGLDASQHTGYGSLPTTDQDEPDAEAVLENHRDDPQDSALEPANHPVPETPSTYAAAGYQRLHWTLSPIPVASAADESFEEPGAAWTAGPSAPLSLSHSDQPHTSVTRSPPSAGPNSASTGSSSSSSSPPQGLLLKLHDMAEDLRDTAMHVLEGDDEDHEAAHGNLRMTRAPPLLGRTAATSSHTPAARHHHHHHHHEHMEGHATIASEIATMTKSIVGCGVLSLPGGIAMYSNQPRALISATIWIILMGAIFAYFCLLLGKICQVTGQSTFRSCWLATMGPGTTAATAVSLANATKAGLADLAYSTILSQTLASLCQTMGYQVSRIQSLWIITVLAILPLCMMKNLHVLAPCSVLGTFGIVLTAVVMVIRLLDGSYRPGGAYYDDLSPDHQPDVGSEPSFQSYAHMLPFVCMLFESFVMHYNSPRFYAELRDASVPRYALVVAGAFGLSTMIFITIAAAGFLTFGGHADGYILNNYSHRDPLATVSRVAIAVAILLTYPLAFIGMRDGVLHSLNVSVSVNALTLLLLGAITLIACVATDLGLINAFGGGTLAMLIVFVLPALMYQAVVEQKGARATYRQRLEVVVAQLLMAVGAAIGLYGSWLALVHAM